MKVVFDTCVVVSAMRSRHGYSNLLLQLAVANSFRVLASPALFLEYEEVLLRPEQRVVHGMSELTVEQFLVGFAAIIEPVRIYSQWRPQLSDADDEIVLETALNGRADAIVTHNVKDFARVTERFGLPIWTAGELVRRLSK